MYSGCPALDAMRDDLVLALRRAGYGAVEVCTVLSPPWTTDWISTRPPQAGRGRDRAAGTAPRHRAGGPVPLTLSLPSRQVHCPHCGSPDTGLVSYFGATACRSVYSCCACSEPSST